MGCDGRYKTIVWHSRDQGAEPTGELYDLEAGPDELLNLWHDLHLAQTRARLLLTMATELTLPSVGWPPREAPFRRVVRASSHTSQRSATRKFHRPRRLYRARRAFSPVPPPPDLGHTRV